MQGPVQVRVVGLPALRMHGPILLPASSRCPVCQLPELSLKPQGRSGLLERLLPSLPALVVRDCLLRARLPEESSKPLILVPALFTYQFLLLTTAIYPLRCVFICIWHMKSCKMQLMLCCIFRNVCDQILGFFSAAFCW